MSDMGLSERQIATSRSLLRFRKYSLFVLCYTLLVILWGAYVRATGSGAGCGRHWPLCDGLIVPRSPGTEMLIEFSHRLSSGLSLIFVCVLVFLAWRTFPKRHVVRNYSVLTLVFILFEAIIGAGLVLFELVAENSSMSRAAVMAVHLINTYVLLYGLSGVVWFSREEQQTSALLPLRNPLYWICMLLLILVAATGAVTALGDTIFIQQGGLLERGHLLIQLRYIHPFLAVATACVLGIFAGVLYIQHDEQVWSKRLSILLLLQLVCGVLNILLQVPVFVQLLHLLLADLIWIVAVCIGFVLAEHHPEEEKPETAAVVSA